MSENKDYIHPEALVDAEWVQAHLADPAVRLIEVDVDTTAYEQGHIQGAVGFNWQKELQEQLVRAPVSKEQLEALLSRSGVTNGHDDRALWRQQQLVCGLGPLDSQVLWTQRCAPA